MSHFAPGYSTIISIKISHLKVCCEKGTLKNFAKFTGKHLCLRPEKKKKKKKETGTGVFLWLLRNCINTFFIEHLWWLAASKAGVAVQSCIKK